MFAKRRLAFRATPPPPQIQSTRTITLRPRLRSAVAPSRLCVRARFLPHMLDHGATRHARIRVEEEFASQRLWATALSVSGVVIALVTILLPLLAPTVASNSPAPVNVLASMAL